MAPKNNQERRARERLLCDARFQNVVLHIQDGDFPVTAINYNNAGLGIFTSQHFSAFDAAEISFTFAGEDTIHAPNLPCKVAYSQDTEVGDQYGLSFITEQIPQGLRDNLDRIEALVAAQSNSEDRYGLFSQDQ